MVVVMVKKVIMITILLIMILTIITIIINHHSNQCITFSQCNRPKSYHRWNGARVRPLPYCQPAPEVSLPVEPGRGSASPGSSER